KSMNAPPRPSSSARWGVIAMELFCSEFKERRRKKLTKDFYESDCLQRATGCANHGGSGSENRKTHGCSRQNHQHEHLRVGFAHVRRPHGCRKRESARA